MHSAKVTSRLTQGQSCLFSLDIWKKEGKNFKVQQQRLTSDCLQLWGGSARTKRAFLPFELAAVLGVVSTCGSLRRSIGEAGFSLGKHAGVATPCSPQGKVCFPRVSRKGWLLCKRQRVMLRQCPAIVWMFSCSEWLGCKAGDTGH